MGDITRRGSVDLPESNFDGFVCFFVSVTLVWVCSKCWITFNYLCPGFKYRISIVVFFGGDNRGYNLQFVGYVDDIK